MSGVISAVTTYDSPSRPSSFNYLDDLRRTVIQEQTRTDFCRDVHATRSDQTRSKTYDVVVVPCLNQNESSCRQLDQTENNASGHFRPSLHSLSGQSGDKNKSSVYIPDSFER